MSVMARFVEMGDDCEFADHVMSNLARHRAWIRERSRTGAQLTVLSADYRPSGEENANFGLGRRLCWWPRGLPNGPWHAIVSSRLTAPPEQRPEWLAALRAACEEASRRSAVLLTGTKTTTHRLIVRAAARLNLACLEIRPSTKREKLSGWLKRIQQLDPSLCPPHLYPAALSPPLEDGEAAETGSVDTLPLVDRAVIAWAEELFVIGLRAGGNLDSLIRIRLGKSRLPGPICIAADPRLVQEPLADLLCTLGAQRWAAPCVKSCGSKMEITKPQSMSRTSSIPFTTGRIQSNPLPCGDEDELTAASCIAEKWPDWLALTHCTHAPRGAWPGETEAEYLDSLWENRGLNERSCFGSLLRIVQKRRIWASAGSLRGKISAVCFSARPANEIPRLRAFQPQRKCWRFEPYGISICREWLTSRGARPVLYGDETKWRSLLAEDRPFFQKQFTRRGMDWSVEQEWRHLGDLDLAELPAESAVVFVPNRDEASRMVRCSPWPVVLLAP